MTILSQKKILIYRDEGVDPFGVRSLVSALKKEGFTQIAWANRTLLQGNTWQEETSLLIFPGGRDVPYHEALQGTANQQIQNFVAKGGRFLGICAGAYYGCHLIEFEKGGPIEVVAERELKFFPGIARGPAYGAGEFCYESQKGARVAHLEMGDTPSAAYYNGGCLFVDAHQFKEVSILARYADLEGKPAAIIECTVGKGSAILSGVHVEMGTHHPMSEAHPHFLALQEIEAKRATLFASLLEKKT